MSNSSTLTPNIAVVVLAAGESRRFDAGESKLLAVLPNGKSLVEQSLAALAGFPRTQVFIVTGRNHERVSSLLDGYNCCFNPDYREGLASSIRRGIAALRASGENFDGALLTLADLPALRSDDFEKLVQCFKPALTGEEDEPATLAVAARYGSPECIGVPAVFDRSLFRQLGELEGDRGAKPLLQRLEKMGKLASVPVPAASGDIDTMEDLVRYAQNPVI